MATDQSQGSVSSHDSGTPERSGEVEDEFSIVSIPEHGEYELLSGTVRIGYAKFRREGDTIVFTHTVIDGGFEGMGLGSKLARHILQDAIEQGLRIVPECSFIAEYVRRHHEYDTNVDWPDTEPGSAV